MMGVLVISTTHNAFPRAVAPWRRGLLWMENYFVLAFSK
jgi:hypothetical protein